MFSILQKKALTFIIPVRHQDNASNWQIVKRNLSDAMNSIASQDCPDWKAVVVANHGADLPIVPHGFSVKRVDYQPNLLFRRESAQEEQFYEAVRIDKGRRVLAGMLHAGELGHVMIVDDDDLVSCRLTSFVAAHSIDNGWFIRDGYIWDSGGSFIYLYESDFSRLCGTSHIIRADLYNLPRRLDDADEDYIKRILGSHIFVREHLDIAQTPLAKLPFPGAVYRVGHSENHSGAPSVFARYFFRRELLRTPFKLARRLSRLRVKSRAMDKEFFGGGSNA